MSLTFNFKDSSVISKPTEEDLSVWKDSLGGTYTGPRKALRVVVEATHAALVNRNARWYSPAKMREGALTFVNGNKPAKILKHHDPHSDPVGVVRGAQFISTVPQDLVNNPDVLVLMSSTSTMKDQIKAMKRLMKAGVTRRPDWKGLGYIEVVADILDKESIEQISDGRFDAVSTSFNSPGHAYCFICGKNWAQDGMCEHVSIGEEYEDDTEEKWPMMLIPGLHLYDEMSLVVKDADPHTVIRLVDGVEGQSFNYESKSADHENSSAIKYEFRDFIEEDKMDITSSTEDQTTLETDAGETKTNVNDLVVEETKKLCTKDISEEGCALVVEYEKLPDSVFCGKDRTYPVIDSITGTACLIVLDKFDDEDKEDIRAKILAKKQLFDDCAPAKEDITVDEKEIPALSDAEVQAAFAKAEAELIARNLKVARECSKCADAHEELEKVQVEVVELKKKLADSNNTLAVLRDELRFQQADYVHQVDRFIDLELKYRGIKEEKLAIVGTLVGKYKSIDIAKESLKNEDMSVIETSIMDKFDIAKAAEKLNDGMARTPAEGTLQSPVESVAKDVIDIQNLEGPAAAVVNSIRDMVSEKRMLEAKKLYNKMIKIGVLDKNLTFETVSAAKNNSAE
jgi:hypothetical protein